MGGELFFMFFFLPQGLPISSTAVVDGPASGGERCQPWRLSTAVGEPPARPRRQKKKRGTRIMFFKFHEAMRERHTHARGQ